MRRLGVTGPASLLFRLEEGSEGISNAFVVESSAGRAAEGPGDHEVRQVMCAVASWSSSDEPDDVLEKLRQVVDLRLAS
jgi:hypothetical protein